MFRALLLHEIRDHLHTARVGMALAGMGLLAVVVALVGVSEYTRRVEVYRQAVTEQRRQLDEVHLYAQVELELIRPPQVLSIFCQGVDRTAGQRYPISVNYRPAGLHHLGDAGNDLMKDFVGVDFTTVVLVVFSFVALALGYGAVAGDREAGTLAAVLANPVPRSAVIAAKLVGGWIVLCIPLLLSFTAAAVVVSIHPAVSLVPEEWLRLGLYLALCALFLATVHALSIMASTLVRRAATALVLCLLAWLVGGVGYLNALPFVMRYGIRTAPYENFQIQARQVWERVGEHEGQWAADHPPPPPATMYAHTTDGILRYGHPRGYAWRQRRNAAHLEQIAAAAAEIYQAQRAAYQPLARMAFAVDRWSVASPFTDFAVLARQLARTTLDDYFYFLRAGAEYRGTFLQYLRSHQAFGGRRWFSDDPPDQEPAIRDPVRVTAAMLAPGSQFMQGISDWVAAQERAAARDPRRRLDLSDLPRFGGAGHRGLAQSLGIMTPGLVVMLLSLGLAVFVSVARMQRYDVRP